jgi:RNA polymerase sigma-70 factor (ECF subfamily)
MRNEHLMRIRSERRTESLDDLEVGASMGTWEEIVWRDQAHRLLQLLDELPVDFRMPIVLCDIEGMQYEEAAAALEIPIGTVRSRLSRGRAMLRRMLGDPNEVLG